MRSGRASVQSRPTTYTWLAVAITYTGVPWYLARSTRRGADPPVRFSTQPRRTFAADLPGAEAAEDSALAAEEAAAEDAGAAVEEAAADDEDAEADGTTAGPGIR